MRLPFGRCVPLVLLCLVLCCLLAGGALAAVPVDILRFNVLVQLGTQDSITVTEEIRVFVPASGKNHGMFRDIPLHDRWKDKGRPAPELTVKAILLDKKPLPLDDTRLEDSILRIYMRDKSAYLDKGVHTFVLKYTMTQQIGFFEEGDELTWNVTGSAWDGIASSMCLVLPPPGTDFTRYKAWLGRLGSRDSPVDIKFMDARGVKALYFKAQRPLNPGEDFTVAVGWPRGVVQKNFTSLRPEDERWFTYALLGLLGINLLFCTLVWWKWGKDPEGGPAVPVFYAPQTPARLRGQRGRKDERLSPAAVNYIHNKKSLSTHGLAALLLSLTGRGDCRITGNSEEGYQIESLQQTATIPEEQLAEELLTGGCSLQDASTFYLMHQRCKNQLDKDYADQWQRNILPMALLFGPCIVLLPALIWYNLGELSRYMADFKLAFGDMTALIAIPGLMIFSLSLFYRAIKYKKGFLAIIKYAAYSLAMIILMFMLLFGNFKDIAFSTVFWIFSPLQWTLMAAMFLMPALFSIFMDAPTVEMARLRQEVAGLALYIGAAEAERLNFANPPDEPLALYHRLLPYAVALNLEKAWGERFAAELARREATLEYDHNMVNHIIVLTDRGYNDYEAELRAAAERSSSGGSSFSGGGGGAGSGGGGGGGGAC